MTLRLEDLTILWLVRCRGREQLAEGLEILRRHPGAFPELEAKVRERLDDLSGRGVLRQRLAALEAVVGTEPPRESLLKLVQFEQTCLEELRREDPALEISLRGLFSFCLCAEGHDEAAVAEATRGVELAKGGTDAQMMVSLLLQRALSQEKLGKNVRAREDYRRVLSLEAGNEMAAAALSQLDSTCLSGAVRLFAVERQSSSAPEREDCANLEETACTVDEAVFAEEPDEEERKEAFCAFERGQTLFHARDYLASVEAYTEALMILDAEEDVGQQLNEFWSRAFVAAALSNRSLSEFYCGAFEAGYRDACCAYALEPSSTRLYRKAINLSATLNFLCEELMAKSKIGELQRQQAVKVQNELQTTLHMTTELLAEDAEHPAVRIIATDTIQYLAKLEKMLQENAIPRAEVKLSEPLLLSPKPENSVSNPSDDFELSPKPTLAPLPLSTFVAKIRSFKGNPDLIAQFVGSFSSGLFATHYAGKQLDFFLLQQVVESLVHIGNRPCWAEFSFETLSGLLQMKGASLLTRMFTSEEQKKLDEFLQRLEAQLSTRTFDELRKAYLSRKP